MQKQYIVKALNHWALYYKFEKEPFKAKAFTKAAESLKAFDQDIIKSAKEVCHLPGIGKSICDKIQDTIDKKEQLEDVMDTITVDQLTKIHGIGETKAMDLINKHNIGNIADLRAAVEKDPSILNTKQKLGLKYVDEYSERIPRKEMVRHSMLIKRAAKKFPEITEIELVGSYRRGHESSGDVDVIICSSDKSVLGRFVDHLTEKGYLNTEFFAKGDHKYLGLSKIEGGKHRRIDILVTDPKEYPFATLYFTGSKLFNVKLRQAAKDMGYNLNEYGLKGCPRELKSEREIIECLGFKYVAPEKRC